jgi:hypothetical protein
LPFQGQKIPFGTTTQIEESLMSMYVVTTTVVGDIVQDGELCATLEGARRCVRDTRTLWENEFGWGYEPIRNLRNVRRRDLDTYGTIIGVIIGQNSAPVVVRIHNAPSSLIDQPDPTLW